MTILFFVVSFLASIVGAICGIGGGVVIKPVLDLLQLASVSTISFLSGVTVLSMSAYSVLMGAVKRDVEIDYATCTPLAIGAAVGGVLGKLLFRMLEQGFPNADQVGAVQALCLLVMTLATLAYTLSRGRIRTHSLHNAPACAIIGLLLGLLSSFMGIGGGPINLVILYFFFSMTTKSAAQSSLYVIFFSQAASLIYSIASRTVPEFTVASFLLMVAGGLLGGIVGRVVNLKISGRAVERLFFSLLVVISGICVFNIIQYT